MVEPLLHRILFEDAEAIVIDKPAGLSVDSPRDGGPSVAAELDGLRLGFARPPGLVHRLDRDTSGCLLLARNPRAHKRYQQAFEAGTVRKTYLAVLAGVPDAEDGRITLALAKRSTREAGWRVVADPRGKSAETCWRLLGVASGRALVAFSPATGRTHQIRVHAATGLGLPILGDPVYGSPDAAPMRLHAWRLSVPRDTKPAIEAEAPLPDRFDAWRTLVEARADA